MFGPNEGFHESPRRYDVQGAVSGAIAESVRSAIENCGAYCSYVLFRLASTIRDVGRFMNG